VQPEFSGCTAYAKLIQTIWHAFKPKSRSLYGKAWASEHQDQVYVNKAADATALGLSTKGVISADIPHVAAAVIYKP